jgi:hypothetical protein
MSKYAIRNKAPTRIGKDPDPRVTRPAGPGPETRPEVIFLTSGYPRVQKKSISYKNFFNINNF